MDIVGRLKTFIDYLGIPVTQFADNCRIPRPTLSQLLNGRNKTVRDELVAKIHEAYPQLNVMWFLFGEGDPILASPSISPSSQALPDPASLFQDLEDKEDPEIPDTEDLSSPENIAKGEPIDFSLDMLPEHDNGANLPRDTVMAEHSRPKVDSAKFSLEIAPGEGKRIVNIIVYYSDRSFQSFIPDPNPEPRLPL